MRLEWVIFCWILARCLFIALPDNNVDLFPFADIVMPVSSYGWVNIEMAFICWLVWKWHQSFDKKWISGTLLLVMAFDWVHFILGGNDMYVPIQIGSYQYPVTNNVLMLLFWGIFALCGKHYIDRRII